MGEQGRLECIHGQFSHSSFPVYLLFCFVMKEVQSRHREKRFPYEDSHTLAQIAQSSFAVCASGAFSKCASSRLDCLVIPQKGRNCLLPVKILGEF